MPEPLDRQAFLEQLQARLDLPDDVAGDVIEEVATHIDDGAAALQSHGDAPDDAERRAIRRLGDPRELGASLSRAHRSRRWLLAATGGGIRGLIVEGTRILWFLWGALVLAGLGMAVVTIVLSGPEMPGGYDLPAVQYYSAVLTPWSSVVPVAFFLAAGAYIGWVLPARVARSAGRSARGVRRGIAAVGIVGGSAVVWCVLPLSLDPVLAVGYPLVPMAFGVAAVRAPAQPTIRLRRRTFWALAAVLTVPIALFAAVLFVVAPGGRTFSTKLSAIGEPPEVIGLATGDVDVFNWPVEAGGKATTIGRLTTVEVLDSADAIVARLPTLRVEVWPVTVQDGVLWAGAAPLSVVTEPTEPFMHIEWSMPHPRTQVTVATVVVGVTPDGRRVILGDQPDIGATPPWHGTIAGWWFGN